jgi:hypothetical protein
MSRLIFSLLVSLGLISCKTIKDRSGLQSTVTAVETSDSDRQIVIGIVQEFYGNHLILGGQLASPAMPLDEALLAEFTDLLMNNARNQTSVETFRLLLEQSKAGNEQAKQKLATYVVQEFAARTNFFDVLIGMKTAAFVKQKIEALKADNPDAGAPRIPPIPPLKLIHL